MEVCGAVGDNGGDEGLLSTLNMTLTFTEHREGKCQCTLCSFACLFLCSFCFLLVIKFGKSKFFFSYSSFPIHQLNLIGGQQYLLYCWRSLWPWVMQTWLLDKVVNNRSWKTVFQDNILSYCFILFWLSENVIHLPVPIFLTYKPRDMDALGQRDWRAYIQEGQKRKITLKTYNSYAF